MDGDLEVICGHLNNISKEGEGRSAADSYISEQISSNPSNFLRNLSQILLLDDISERSARSAITLISVILNPPKCIEKARIQQIISDSESSFPETLAALKEAVFRGIMFHDQSIQQQSAFLICLVSKIDPKQWPELPSSLISVLSGSIYDSFAKCGAIRACNQLISCGYPLQDPKEFISPLFHFIGSTLDERTETDPIYISEMIQLFSIIIATFQVIDSDAIAEQTLNVIELTISSGASSVVKSAAIQALFSLFRGGYSYMQAHAESIFNVTISCLKSDDQAVAIEAIRFWSDASAFEAEVIGRKHDGLSPSSIPAIASQVLLPVYFEIISKTEINDSESIEEGSLSRLSQSISEGISNFSLVDPERVANLVFSFFSSNPENGLLPLLSIVESRPTKYVESLLTDLQSSVISFLSSKSDNATRLAMLIIRESSINYKLFCNNIDEFNAIIDVMETIVNRSPAVVLSACDLLSSIIQNFNPYEADSILSELFSKIYQFVQSIVARTDSFTEPIFLSAHEVLCIAIRFSPSSLFDQMVGLLSVATSVISDSLTPSKYQNSVKFVIQQSMCDLISSVTNRIGQRVDPFADDLFNSIFALLAQKESEVYEEAMLTLAALISNSTEIKSVSALIDIVLSMMHSESPGLIYNATFPLEDIFRVTKGSESFVSSVFELCLPMIVNENYGSAASIRLIEMLADIIKSWPQSITTQLRDEYYNVLILYSSASNEMADAYFEAILFGYSQVISCSKEDKDFLTENKRKFFAIIDSYEKAKVRSSSTMNMLFSLLVAIGTAFGSSANLLLNKASTVAMVLEAKRSDDKCLSKRADYVLHFLKTNK